ncbi:MAG: hypothetical protein M1825_003637 [Sarcosagium campestre]|nr:MAG: hypothetical protein M1825_003637 [Sarcosagium campestre]
MLVPAKDLRTSDFNLTGSGQVSFERLSQVASQSTSYATRGPLATDYGSVTLKPNNDYTIASFKCPAGEARSYRLRTSEDTKLRFVQKKEGSNPIGLFLRKCDLTATA